jgi:type IV secretion system protein TrbF
MTNAFSRPQERYGASPPVDTPFRKAAQVWDRRLGDQTARAANWRMIAFGLLLLNLLCLGGLILDHASSRVVAYVVPIDKYARPGRIEVAGAAYVPTQAETGYFIADWVRLVRSKSTDPIVLRDNWTRAYHFISADAAPQLSAYARDNDPFARVGQEAVNVEVVSILARSAHTFQIDWRETAYDQGGRATATNWTGVFTVTQKPPQNEAELRANPLGLLITAFQWSREL